MVPKLTESGRVLAGQGEGGRLLQAAKKSGSGGLGGELGLKVCLAALVAARGSDTPIDRWSGMPCVKNHAMRESS